MKRLIFLFQSADWILMAGAEKRRLKHHAEASIVPFNKEGLARIGKETERLYLLIHGLPGGQLAGLDAPTIAQQIADRLSDGQVLKLTLDVCYGATAGGQRPSLAKQIEVAIKQHQPKCSLMIAASEGPSITGWKGKRGYVEPTAKSLMDAVQNYLAGKHHTAIAAAKEAVNNWARAFEQPDLVLRTAGTAASVFLGTHKFFADFEKFARGAGLDEADLRGLFGHIRANVEKDDKLGDFRDKEISVDVQLQKLSGLLAGSLNPALKKKF